VHRFVLTTELDLEAIDIALAYIPLLKHAGGPRLE
jgi:hypothetical protein